MPDAARAVSGIPRADPGGRVTPRFWHRLIRFRHFNSGSLALASLNHACWDHVPTFPQRSPPSLLTTAACGSLRSAPDSRTRRALLHLPYSCALPCGRAMLVTQHPTRTLRSIHSTCLSALVTDWAMETWYRSASKYPTSCWHWRTRWSTDVTREGGLKMKRPRRQFLHLAAGAAALPAVSRFAFAQAYPSRPVRIMVGFPPGGP